MMLYPFDPLDELRMVDKVRVDRIKPGQLIGMPMSEAFRGNGPNTP